MAVQIELLQNFALGRVGAIDLLRSHCGMYSRAIGGAKGVSKLKSAPSGNTVL
jgi:hypothetical protein